MSPEWTKRTSVRLNQYTKTMNIQAKELIDLLEEKDMWNYGDAKPCSIFINQGNRFGVVTMGNLDDYNVAYKMPNGRLYAKKVTKKEADQILHISMSKSYQADGSIVLAFGF